MALRSASLSLSPSLWCFVHSFGRRRITVNGEHMHPKARRGREDHGVGVAARVSLHAMRMRASSGLLGRRARDSPRVKVGAAFCLRACAAAETKRGLGGLVPLHRRRQKSGVGWIVDGGWMRSGFAFGGRRRRRRCSGAACAGYDQVLDLLDHCIQCVTGQLLERTRFSWPNKDLRRSIGKRA